VIRKDRLRFRQRLLYRICGYFGNFQNPVVFLGAYRAEENKIQAPRKSFSLEIKPQNGGRKASSVAGDKLSSQARVPEGDSHGSLEEVFRC
jgi:hypothetical protein